MEASSLTNWVHPYILSSALLLVLWYAYRKIEVWILRLPPGPIGIPILGYAPFIGKNVHLGLHRLCQKYGKICSTSAGMKRIILLGDSETAREVLSHPAALSRPEQFFNFLPGEGGFVGMNGELWERERRFVLQSMRNMGLGRGMWNEVIQEDVAALVKDIAELKGQPVYFKRLLDDSTIYNMLALMFGRQFFFKEGVSQEIGTFRRGNQVFKKHYRFYNPTALFPWMLKYFIKYNICGYRKLAKDMDSFKVAFRKEMLKRMNSDEYDPGTDFIMNYLQNHVPKSLVKENRDQVEEYLVGHLSIFISTIDTATISIFWALLLMAEHPEVQKKVQEELDEVIGRDGITSWNDQKKLPYVLACMKEMHRWVTVFPIYLPRVASKTFEYKGYVIPKGAYIFTTSWTMHRSPKYWDKPEDFRPERFMTVNGKEPNTEGYAPFSFGKRNCPSENISMMLLFLYFTGVMQKFTIKCPPGLDPDLTQRYNGTLDGVDQELCFIER